MPLIRDKIEQMSINSTKKDFRENVTSDRCYKISATVRKLEPPETTTEWTSRPSISSEHYSGNSDGIFQSEPHYRNASTMRFSATAKPQDGVFENATEFTSRTLPAETTCCKLNDTTADTIRLRNMMAIVRFMMKLLKVVAEDAPSCPTRTQTGNTVICLSNVNVVNDACKNNTVKQKNIDDETAMTSQRTRQNLTNAEWQSTIDKRIREGSSSPEGEASEFFSKASPRPVASTSPNLRDKTLKNDGLSKLFGASMRKEVHGLTVSNETSSSSTLGSLLFYESGQKSTCGKNASQENTSVVLTGTKGDLRAPVNEVEANSKGKESRSDQGSVGRSPLRPRNRPRGVVDRFRFGKQEIVSFAAAPGKDNARGSSSPEEQAEERGFGCLKSNGVANKDMIVSTLPERSKKSTKKGGRTRSLKNSARGVSPAGSTEEQRMDAQQLPFEKKSRGSRGTLLGGAAAPEKLVFRRARGEIHRPRDPNLAGAGDSLGIEGRASPEAAELPTDASHVSGDPRLTGAIQCSPTSTSSAGDSRRATSSRERVNGGIANERTRFVMGRARRRAEILFGFTVSSNAGINW